jgi:hypothetical protein
MKGFVDGNIVSEHSGFHSNLESPTNAKLKVV